MIVIGFVTVVVPHSFVTFNVTFCVPVALNKTPAWFCCVELAGLAVGKVHA